MTTPKDPDPKKVNSRLYDQVDQILMMLEAEPEDGQPRITLKERIAALIAIARIQVAFVGLRKEKPQDDEHAAGSKVRAYAGAFADDAGGRKKRARSTRAVDPGPVVPKGFDLDSGDDDDESDALN